MEVALSQTGGNGIEFWGDTNAIGLSVNYLEVDNAQGRAVDGAGVYGGQSLNGVTVGYGRASNTNQNNLLDEANNQLPWDGWDGVVYQDVQPAP